MPQNAFFSWNCNLLVSKKMMQRHFFPTLHPLSLVFLATAIVVAFVLLHNSRFNFHCYTQREAMPTQKSCAKDYKGHALMQTSFTEPPNSSPSGPETQFTNYPSPPPVSISPSAVLYHYHTVQTHFPGLSSSPPMECWQQMRTYSCSACWLNIQLVALSAMSSETNHRWTV